MMNMNSGYTGYSMSNRAVEAYEDHQMPLSKWTKKDMVREVYLWVNSLETFDFDFELLKKQPAAVVRACVLEMTSWHHTGGYCAETSFYGVTSDKLAKLTDAIILRERAEYDEAKANKPAAPVEETWRCAFLVWGGTRNHPKATEYTEVGTIRGNWFYRADGSKKSITANGFRRVEKVSE